MGTLNAPGMTKWTNPLGKPKATLHLYKGPPVIIPHPAGPGFPGTVKDTGFLDVSLAPGEEVWLPSHYDKAIQNTDENGVVQSGECPWLIKNDGEKPVLNEALDPVEQQRLQAEIDAEKARIKANEAAAEIARAQSQLADAKRIQEENDARAKADQAAREAFEKDRAELAQLKADLAKDREALAKKNADLDKLLEQATKPSSGAGGDSGSGGGGAADASKTKPKG